MQAFKRHLIRESGACVIAWDSDHGSGRHTMPQQIPFAGDAVTGKYRETRKIEHVRMTYYSMLEAAAILRFERQRGGSYAAVVGATSCIAACAMIRETQGEMHCLTMADSYAALRHALNKMKATCIG